MGTEQTEKQGSSEKMVKGMGKAGSYREIQVTDSKQPRWAGGCRGGQGTDGQHHSSQQEE